MLALDPKDIFDSKSIMLKNKKDGVYTFSKAYTVSDTAEFELSVHSGLGVFAPCLHMRQDGSKFTLKSDFIYDKRDGEYDIYTLSFAVSEMCGEKPALMFFRISFSIGDNTMYFVSRNNVIGDLTYDGAGNEFKMLIYSDNYSVPADFYDGVMYHIFVDRFCKGSKKVPIRYDAVINDDWYEGIPQYGNMPGDFCSNNMFFGGTLYGIVEKLDYIEELGVKTLYLSPIFEAYSNHKYDTGDYTKVDGMFGGDEALDMLIQECVKRNIRIILDGVFNHTGDDSLYFNKYGRYGSSGAYNDPQSEYTNWYKFTEYPDHYDSWWGIEILPKLNTANKKVQDFLVGKNGIVAKYIKKGIGGFRLDVADELPDSFLEKLRTTARNYNPDAVIIGEVWENAADKCAYGSRREYFRGKQLDGVMNYPIKNGIVEYIRTGNTDAICDAVCDIYSSYPSPSSLALMNILGTHDTERILTALSTDRYKGMCGNELSKFRLTAAEKRRGLKMLLCASALQFTLPGVPSVFYGDEAGVEGCRDPFCRKTYPWGKENKKLLSHYKKLGKLRASEKALCRGGLELKKSENGIFGFERSADGEKIRVMVNSADTSAVIPSDKAFTELYSIGAGTSGDNIVLSPMSFTILKTKF